MSDRDALLAAVLAHPDEDTPRLAYADWLDERGEDPERAEFIRLQIGLPAMIDAGDPQWPGVRARLRYLRRANESRWAGAVAPLVVSERGSFDRGFLTSIKGCEHFVSTWLNLLGVALAEHPIETVWLDHDGYADPDRRRSLEVMAGWPQAWKIRKLGLTGRARIQTGELPRLVENPHLRRLAHLVVGPSVEAADLRALTPLADRLTGLEVGTSGRAPVWGAALGELLAATAVERLRVSIDYHGDDCLRHVLDAAAGSRVSELRFWLSQGAPDLTAFARWPRISRLTALDLGSHRYTPEQFVRLFADADLRSLTRFRNNPVQYDNRRTEMGRAGEAWAALLASPCAERLTDLDLHTWGLAGAEFGPLARGAMPNLRHLNLDETGCGDAAADAIAGAAFAPQLRTLGLGHCGITGRGAERLLAADFPRLGELRLWGNTLGEDVRRRFRERFGDRVSV